MRTQSFRLFLELLFDSSAHCHWQRLHSVWQGPSTQLLQSGATKCLSISDANSTSVLYIVYFQCDAYDHKTLEIFVTIQRCLPNLPFLKKLWWNSSTEIAQTLCSNYTFSSECLCTSTVANTQSSGPVFTIKGLCGIECREKRWPRKEMIQAQLFFKTILDSDRILTQIRLDCKASANIIARHHKLFWDPFLSHSPVVAWRRRKYLTLKSSLCIGFTPHWQHKRLGIFCFVPTAWRPWPPQFWTLKWANGAQSIFELSRYIHIIHVPSKHIFRGFGNVKGMYGSLRWIARIHSDQWQFWGPGYKSP